MAPIPGLPAAIPDVNSDGVIGSFDLTAAFMLVATIDELDSGEFPLDFEATYFPFGDPATINLSDEADQQLAKALAAAAALQADGHAGGRLLGTDPSKAAGRIQQMKTAAGYALGQNNPIRKTVAIAHDARAQRATDMPTATDSPATPPSSSANSGDTEPSRPTAIRLERIDEARQQALTTLLTQLQAEDPAAVQTAQGSLNRYAGADNAQAIQTAVSEHGLEAV